ncbi:MAG: nucleoside triphosphate pyrophosphatase [Pirellula sp.]|nr:septum formation protein Maf [Planctomycetota bacterium]
MSAEINRSEPDLFLPPEGFVPDSRPIILASSSPRRRKLMAEYGYRFEVIEPDPAAECGICSRETPPELVARLAYQKAADVIQKIDIDERIVLSCDTVAEYAGMVLGKPNDIDHAKEMLLRLRGREHRVYSGLCLWSRASGHRIVRVDCSTLVLKQFTDLELQEYLASDLWVGKAGSLGFQDGPPWLTLLSGSATNVVGLPMELLSQMLRGF